MNQFVQLQMNGSCITILRILDEEYHEKRDNRGAGIDDQLPGIRVMKEWSADTPHHDDPDRDHKRPPGAEVVRASRGKFSEPVRTGYDHRRSVGQSCFSRFFCYFYGNFGRPHDGPPGLCTTLDQSFGSHSDSINSGAVLVTLVSHRSRTGTYPAARLKSETKPAISASFAEGSGMRRIADG